MTKLEAEVQINRLMKIAEDLQTDVKVAIGEYVLDKTDDNFRRCELLSAELRLIVLELKEKVDEYAATFGANNV